jgi:hypothetical protein
MPDTGAPWNLPYPSPSDLVRDAPQAFEDLAVATAAGLDDASLIQQVVQTVKTDTFTTTSTSFVNVTGLSVTITPSSATNKVLILVDTNISNTNTTSQAAVTSVRLTGGNAENYVGDAASSRLRVAASATSIDVFRGDIVPWNTSLIYLDSPGVSTAVTYQLQMSTSGATAVLNRSGADADNVRTSRTASSITVFEVAA